MQAVSGRLLDRFGTRNGLSLAVLWYSTAAMLTSLATGLRASAAAVPAGRGRGRELAGGDQGGRASGSRGASAAGRSRCSTAGPRSARPLATVLVPLLYVYFGSWRPAFVITGALGLPVADPVAAALPPAGVAPAPGRRGAAHDPRRPRARRARERPPRRRRRVPVAPRCCAPHRQTWGAIASRGLTDPVWFMITDWFAIYLVSQRLQASRRRRWASGCRSWPPTSATSSAAASRARSSGGAGAWAAPAGR